jgi:hypothetical protein
MWSIVRVSALVLLGFIGMALFTPITDSPNQPPLVDSTA